ncbi:MAG: hypothetical protein RIQ62_652 [Bacteroidota bacterium]
MHPWLYRIGLGVYNIFLHIASPFVPKAAALVQGRNLALSHMQAAQIQSCLWFHSASVGEFEQGYPIYLKLKEHFPTQTFVFTFFSPSGYHYVTKRFPDLKVFYLPADNPSHARQLIETLRPKAAFFIKYEFWYFYLRALAENQVPAYLISGIFRPNQPFFRGYGSLHRQMLQYFRHLYVQNEESKALLQTINIQQVSVCGDTRYDRVKMIKDLPLHDQIIDDFCGDHKILIAGSVWNSDNEVLLKLIHTLPENWKLMIVPHEPEQYTLSSQFPPYARYTQFHSQEVRILVVDTLGLLSKVYRKSQLAYIGGGYGKGIHNTLEAAVYHVPVLFGPRYAKFNEAKEMLAYGSAFCTETQWSEIESLLHHEQKLEAVKALSVQFMDARQGISDCIVSHLREEPFWTSLSSE